MIDVGLATILSAIIGGLITALVPRIIDAIQSKKRGQPTIAVPSGVERSKPKKFRSLYMLAALMASFGTLGFVFAVWRNSTFRPTPTATEDVSNTILLSTNVPTPNSTSIVIIATPQMTPTLLNGLFLSDEFNGIDLDIWKPNGLEVNAGQVVANFSNSENQHTGIYLDWLTAYSIQIKTIEFAASISGGSENGEISIISSCSGIESGATKGQLSIKLLGNKKIAGEYLVGDGTLAQNITLKEINLDQLYIIRLVQLDGKVVVYIDNVIIEPQNYPCNDMRTLRLLAGASAGNFINGYFEYIKLWSEPVPPTPE